MRCSTSNPISKVWRPSFTPTPYNSASVIGSRQVPVVRQCFSDPLQVLRHASIDEHFSKIANSRTRTPEIGTFRLLNGVRHGFFERRATSSWRLNSPNETAADENFTSPSVSKVGAFSG